uniref:Protein RADIALIS-like 3 n=1 Tax=Elaeis guineensis var. tenera TaxID=51953 RepID=A0A6I9REA0_ELAGV|nr:protein RADIALIS-like 3 [Elaeis guineensis]
MASSNMLIRSPQLQIEWSRSEDKIFELALVQYPEGTPDRWSLITAKLPGKTLSQVLHHYQVLIYDLELIESGRVEIPDYKDNEQEGDSSSEQHPSDDWKIELIESGRTEIPDYKHNEQVSDNFSEERPPDDRKSSSGSSQRDDEHEQPMDP